MLRKGKSIWIKWVNDFRFQALSSRQVLLRFQKDINLVGDTVTKVLMENGSLTQVESIAECSPWSILQYF